jgi:HAMP domain-containing protein
MTVLLALVVNLIVSYSRNLRLLFNNETDVLERVSRGDLSRTVPVATRDEFGVIAGHTNSMIRGLRHRTKMITALKLAEEVQQNLLPVSAPDHSGHEPALLYDPAQERFEILMGEGLVLGVEAKFEYREYNHQGWTPGSVLVVGTDGISETRNAKDELFGLDRLKETMANHSGASALAIQTAVLDRLNQFRGQTGQEDDVTLVVVKLL